MTSETSPPSNLLPMELPLTPSAAGSRAKTLAWRDMVLAWKVSAAVCGASFGDLFASYDRASCSWKTSQRLFTEGLGALSETWPNSGMLRNGIAYRLPPLAPDISAIECGLLPTPMKGRCGPSGSHGCKTARRLLGRDWYLPEEAEELMMFPTGWTELGPAETP